MVKTSIILKEFLGIYNLPEDSEFKRLELEDALIDRFGNLKYNKYKGWTDRFTNKIYQTMYAVDLDTDYSIYSLYSYGTDYETNSTEDALIVFFIKYGRKPEGIVEDYYFEMYCKILHEIVKDVYKT